MDPTYSVSPSLLSYSNYGGGGRRRRLGGRRRGSRRGGSRRGGSIRSGMSQRLRSILSRLQTRKRRY